MLSDVEDTAHHSAYMVLSDVEDTAHHSAYWMLSDVEDTLHLSAYSRGQHYVLHDVVLCLADVYICLSMDACVYLLDT